MANNTEGRRDFMGMALGGFTALGGIGALYAMKRSWDPLPSVKAAGFTTVDLSGAQPNVLNVEKWRGKPIFVLKKTADMKADDRDVIVGSDRFHVSIRSLYSSWLYPGVYLQMITNSSVHVTEESLMHLDTRYSDHHQVHLKFHHLKLMEIS